MKIDRFVNVQTSTAPSALSEDDLTVILFPTDVSTALNWAGLKVKSYTDTASINLDFPENHRARTVAAKIFAQTPSVLKIKIARWDVGQSLTAALDIAESVDNKWFGLVGARGEDIFLAADWVETKSLKYGVFATEDPASLDMVITNSIKARFYLKGYKKSSLVWHHQSGTRLISIKIDVANGIATVSAASIAQVDTVTIDTALVSTVYELSFGGTSIKYTSGASTTKTTIRDGLIAAFNGVTGLGATAAVGGVADFTVTANDPGTPYSLAAVANMTVVATTLNQAVLHNRHVGDPVVIEDSNVALNGLHTVASILLQSDGKSDQFTFNTTAVTSDITGAATMDGGFSYPDAAVLGMFLAYPIGLIDAAFKPLNLIEPTPEDILTGIVASDLESNNCNYYTTVGGKPIFFEGVNGVGIGMDQMIGLGLWLPDSMKKSIFSHIAGQDRFGIDDAGLMSMQILMDQSLARAQRATLTRAFVVDPATYPTTKGLPLNAQTGDHYVSYVPTLAQIPKSESSAGKVLTGCKYIIEGVKGWHFTNIFGQIK